MYTLIIILTVIVALLLIGVVLIQKSKGGGLSSAFAGSNQFMGVRRTNDFVEKATWVLASVICLLAIIAAFVQPRTISGNEIRTQQSATALPAQEGANQYGTSAPALPTNPVETAPFKTPQETQEE